jgi:hypothetical protein
MSLLQEQIKTFVDSNPGVMTEKIQDDRVEIEIRDAGSARAAQITFGAFGQLMAARRAEQRYADVVAAGKTLPTLAYLQRQEAAAVHEISERLVAARTETDNRRGQQGYAFKVTEEEGDLLLETMAAAPELTEQLPQPHPALAYYAGITPHLLETSVTSVDGNSYKYSI